MSRDYKLNKSELGRIKREHKLYQQYLPVLTLKLEQLQLEQNRTKRAMETAFKSQQQAYSTLKPFVPLMSDSLGGCLSDLMKVRELKTASKNVAGVSVRAFLSMSFCQIDVPSFQTPPWLLMARPLLEAYLQSEAQLCLLREESAIIGAELHKATKKVNLFDMVLIPQAKEAIKRIKIALQDEQVASISRGKIAKLKRAQLAEVGL